MTVLLWSVVSQPVVAEPLPKDLLLNLDGSTTSTKKPKPSPITWFSPSGLPQSKLFAPVGASFAPTLAGSRYAPPSRLKLSQAELEETLKTVFQWTGSGPYKSYFLLGSGTTGANLRQSVASHYKEMVDKNFEYKCYPASPELVVTLIVPAPLYQKLGPESSNEIFIYPSSFNQPVPIGVGNMMAAHFASGFVTRTLLGELVKSMEGAVGGLTPEALDIIAQSPGPLSSNLTSADQYAGKTMEQAVSDFLKNQNGIQAASVILGWQAASQMDLLTGSDKKFREAAWKLMRARFDAQEMGAVSSYTLNYLLGFTQVAVLRAKSNDGPLDKYDEICKRLEDNEDVRLLKRLPSALYTYLLHEFHANATNPAFAAEPGSRKALSDYFSYLQGWQEGASRAADETFYNVFQFAYGVGYRDGFKDGYERGYAAGYRDGYQRGWDDAWNQANERIRALEKELSTLKSLDAWIDRVDKVVTIGQKVIGIAGAIGGFL